MVYLLVVYFFSPFPLFFVSFEITNIQSSLLNTNVCFLVPAPINSWLKRKAVLGSYKFIGNKSEVELKFERVDDSTTASSGKIDLVHAQPMILKVFMYSSVSRDARERHASEAIARKMLFNSDLSVEEALAQVIEKFGPGSFYVLYDC